MREILFHIICKKSEVNSSRTRQYAGWKGLYEAQKLTNVFITLEIGRSCDDQILVSKCKKTLVNIPQTCAQLFGISSPVASFILTIITILSVGYSCALKSPQNLLECPLVWVSTFVNQFSNRRPCRKFVRCSARRHK